MPTVTGEKLVLRIPSATINITEKSKVSYAIELPRFIYTPINFGQSVGSISYYSNDNLVLKENITINQNLSHKNNKFKLFLEIFKGILFGL